MKYEVYVSEVYYGFATVEADSAEEAKLKAEQLEFNYHSSEFLDVTVEPIGEKNTQAEEC